MSAFKIVFWGAAQSGKTSILSKAVTDQFSKDYVPTIGANSFLKAIGSSQDWFSIWDLAGDEKFRNVITHYFKESKALVYCIDLTQEADNNAIKKDLAAFRKLVPNAPIILVGTKSDLPNPKISSDQLAALALEHQAKAHFITSAKNNGNITRVSHFHKNILKCVG